VIRDDELFDAVAVGLGRFGIIYSVVVEVVPAYSLARERVMFPFPAIIARLRDGIAQGSFVGPLLSALPAPSPNLRAVSARPRAMELVIDSRNPAIVHVVRRWRAAGPDLDVGFQRNQMCDMGAAAILSTGAAALPLLGMNPAFVNNPLLLLDPSRVPRLATKQAELQLLAAVPMRPGEALAAVTNADWEFGITKVPDVLALVVYLGQFKTQRGPSYAVMTGPPAFDVNGAPLPHEIHWCYQANSCEVMFDAADPRYIDFVDKLGAMAPGALQAGYISLRYSRRSRALLSMHNVSSDHAVSIEVSTLKGLRGSAAWIEYVLAETRARGGRPHWGQQNHPTAADTQALYGARLDRWRAVLGGLSGRSTLFSSAFTIARGLEPQGRRAIPLEGRAADLRSTTADAVSLLLLDGSPP
jgi:D-arabinono-1,4-lactone oxidase